MQVKSIAEQLFFTTVRIDTVNAEGAEGSGTGFFFEYKLSGDAKMLVCVTNKHVVMGQREGSFSFHKMENDLPVLGEGFRLEISAADWPGLWFGHPDNDIDIAICPLLPIVNYVREKHGWDLFYRTIAENHIPTAEQAAELDAVEPIMFVGYPNGIWDSVNLLPVARRGTTASPIEVDFDGTPRFIIDASVFGGSSGSPVFILNNGSWVAKGRDVIMGGSRFHFVGVVAAVFYRTSLNKIIPIPIPTKVEPMVEQREMIDLGIVFKARTVVETVEAFVKARGIQAPTADSGVPSNSLPNVNRTPRET